MDGSVCSWSHGRLLPLGIDIVPMAFAHPEAWLWALVAAPLLLIHLWPRRPLLVHVPTLFLWQQTLGTEKSGLRRLFPRRWRALAVDGLALVLIVAAMAEPVDRRLGWRLLASGALGVLAVQTIAVLRRVAPRRPPFWLALRGAMLLTLAVALTGPKLRGAPRPVYPVFLIDESASIAPEAAAEATEFVARAVAGRNDWAEVRFAEKPRLSGSDELGLPVSLRHATDLEAALALGCRIGLAIPDSAPHVILLSDGVATQGNLEAAVEAARREGIPISTVPLASCDPEVYVAEVQTPAAVRQHEPFEATVVLGASREGEGDLEIAAPSDVLASHRIRVKPGEHGHKVRLSLDGSPDAKLTFRLLGFDDTLAENNAQEATVTVLPPRRALLVEGRPNVSKHLVKVLKEGKLHVEVRSAADLPEEVFVRTACDAVVLVNVPATAITPQQLAKLTDYVRRGGGLVVIGGDQAFIPGGYRHTALEAILPVESEPARQVPRSGVAIVFVVDRSQSMEDGGAIDLARDAIRRAVDLLGPEDQVGILEFDEGSRWVSPMEPLGNKAELLARIGSITAGGRTDMAPAIQKAYLALRESFAAEKHIVVLTDGISHPADFEALVEQIAGEGITLSTVALGREASRPLLEDMARVGKGRAYICDSPQAVPSVLVMETARASGRGLVEEPFFPSPTQRLPSQSCGDQNIGDQLFLTGLNLTGTTPPLLGYAQTRLKPDATMTLTAVGGEPLLAWWRVGEGVCAAFTSDAESRWSAAWLEWPGFSQFWINVVRGVMPPERGSGCIVNRFRNSFPEEFRIRATDCALLERVSKRTGGVYCPSPQEIWEVADPGVLPPKPIHGWILALAVLLLLPDASARRFILGRMVC